MNNQSNLAESKLTIDGKTITDSGEEFSLHNAEATYKTGEKEDIFFYFKPVTVGNEKLSYIDLENLIRKGLLDGAVEYMKENAEVEKLLHLPQLNFNISITRR